MPHALAKSTQITDAHSTHENCNHCGGSYKQPHLCAIATQVALLYVHGGDDPTMSNELRWTRRLQCKICMQQYTTTKDLQYHLSFDHNLWTHNWNQSRDMTEPQNFTCAHCSRDMQSLGNLRGHITSGYCQEFNPSRVPQTLPTPPHWLTQLEQGTVL